jgi:UTP--glucose-1-phosphate uridylyltransferase
MKTVRKAVLPVAGWATRLLPVTKSVPKALMPLLDKPIIHYIVEEAVQAGIDEIIFTVSDNSVAVANYFRPSAELEAFLAIAGNDVLLDSIRDISRMARFTAIPQANRNGLRGLGAAILSARPLIGDEPFAVLLPNDLIFGPIACMAALCEIHRAAPCVVIAAHSVSPDDISTYGNIAVDPAGARDVHCAELDPQRVLEVVKLVQRPERQQRLSDFAIIGRYILPPEIFSVLEATPPGYAGELQLTDAIQGLLAGRHRVLAFAFEGQYIDTRSKLGILRATLELVRRDPELARAVRDLCAGIVHDTVDGT